MGPYARVAVLRPVHRTFHYRIPEHLGAFAVPGARCAVPFSGTRTVGFVVALEDAAETPRVKDLLEVLDPAPSLPADLLRFGMWLSAYYHHPPGETLAALFPPGSRAGSEVVYRLGERCPGDGTREPEEEKILGRLRAREILPVSAFRPGEQQVVGRLVQKGWVEREWRGRAPEAPRGEDWFRLLPEAPSPDDVAARSPRQSQALCALAEGPRSARLLSAEGVSRAALLRCVEKGWISRGEKPAEAADPALYGLAGSGSRPRLTPEQAGAVDQVREAMDSGAFVTILLEGVTGSGKTEVYIRAVEEARGRGRGAIVLVPEIALTPQVLGRFVEAFGQGVAVLHSGLGERERRLQWERVRGGEARVALGTRSAVFAPVRDLGLVVVDEEHDPSYKQEEGLRYHAKHAALVRARACGAVAVLGSATPDIETYHAAAEGRFRRAVLPRRVGGAQPPSVEVIDLRQEEGRRRSPVLLSEPLRAAVGECLRRGEQALLFLNRRGFSPALVCRTCGEALGCRRCSIALTLHRSRGPSDLLCHHCGVRREPPETCPSCGSPDLAAAGAGTQRLLEEALGLWPSARIVRLDRDTAASGPAVIRSVHQGEVDILVGTQMIAKGHHFPRLTAVGVVDADLSLHFPDFRAAERTFQLLMQVAGRAGRERLEGRVLLQTRNPHHPAIAAAARGDYEAFARGELEARREAGFPPFRRVALVRVSAPAEADGQGAAAEVAERARAAAGRGKVEILGPARAPIERVRGRWRYQVFLRGPGPEAGPVQQVLRRLRAVRVGSAAADVRVQVDVDPVSFL